MKKSCRPCAPRPNKMWYRIRRSGFCNIALDSRRSTLAHPCPSVPSVVQIICVNLSNLWPNFPVSGFSFQVLPPSLPLVSPFGLPTAGLARIPPGMSSPSGCNCSLPSNSPVAWFPASARWHVFSFSGFRFQLSGFIPLPRFVFDVSCCPLSGPLKT
jgi:hypothetical protein